VIILTKPVASASNLKADLNLGYVWFICIVAALGGLLFGWDFVVIGGAKPFFQAYFQLTSNAEIGWANSCAFVGCLAGALIAGGLSDKFGQRRFLLLSALLFAVTSLGNALAATFSIFIFWRLLGGVAIGLASNLSPVYIAEVAPAQMRGKLVSINQLTIVVGSLLAQIINWWLVRHLPTGATEDFIRNSWFGQSGWRWMFGLITAPSLLFFIGMLIVPESPRWLAKAGRAAEAQEVLARIGGEEFGAASLAEIESTLASEGAQKVRFSELLRPKLAKVLFLGLVLTVSQQWCGLNVVWNYAQEIFKGAGYDISNVLPIIVLTGLVNVVFTLIALGTVDGVGRRLLLLIGAGGMAALNIAMGFCYATGVKGLPLLLLVLAAVGCYAMTLAPVVWVVISEIFPNRIRGAAMSVPVSALWTACFFLTYTFPILNARLGAAGTFWLYGAICALSFIFIACKLPETKGKTLEQIERELA
jgi:sugar porter (SP) family MFS transporter